MAVKHTKKLFVKALEKKFGTEEIIEPVCEARRPEYSVPETRPRSERP